MVLWIAIFVVPPLVGERRCVSEASVILRRTVSSPRFTLETFGGTGSRVFIEVPLPMGKTEHLSVYLTPNLAEQAFGERYPITIHEKRIIDQWMSFFASLAATPQPTAEENDKTAERFREALAITAYMPRVSHASERQKAESLSPESDQEFEYYERAFTMNIPGELGSASPEEQL